MGNIKLAIILRDLAFIFVIMFLASCANITHGWVDENQKPISSPDLDAAVKACNADGIMSHYERRMEPVLNVQLPNESYADYQKRMNDYYKAYYAQVVNSEEIKAVRHCLEEKGFHGVRRAEFQDGRLVEYYF